MYFNAIFIITATAISGGSLQSLDWNGESCIICDADIEFSGDECTNLKWPVGYHHCRKHPFLYCKHVATQSIVILSQ